MKEINIEWQHLDKDGETCTRCSDTGKTLLQVIEDLSRELVTENIKLVFSEIKLDENEIPESNKIFFNGVALEVLIPELKVIENPCPSCSDLLGKNTCCRAVEYKGKINEDIPESLIRKAVNITLEKLEQ
ncbi:MAG TPA: molybdenum cofactor biosysynthesis protein [Cyanobacteria bacterium UBA9971]|nr:molybdenum cofactor biosysynthesis protein [Cyanobacteria bacterium UBA9971]